MDEHDSGQYQCVNSKDKTDVLLSLNLTVKASSRSSSKRGLNGIWANHTSPLHDEPTGLELAFNG